jgi:Transcriptional regulator
MKNKEDLRIIRTKKLIMTAFVELLREKTFEKITIREISERAMINRATFYAHFENKQDLYENLMTYFLSDLSKILEQDQLADDKNVYVKSIEIALAKFYQFIKENPEFAVIILDSNNEEQLLKKLMIVFGDHYAGLLNNIQVLEKDMKVPIDFIVFYIIGIVTSTLKWWMKDTSAMKPADLSHLVIKLISNGHLTVQGVNIDRN